MNDQERTPKYGSPDGQHPHVPGHDPLGTGMPRQQEAWPSEPAEDAPAPEAETGASAGEAPVDEADAAPEAGDAPAGDGAPLGGDDNTEDQLTADTAVERDALKSLDPDDTPA